MASAATIREANAAIPSSHGVEQRLVELAVGNLERGIKGGLTGLALGALAGWGVTQMPDHGA